MLVSRFCECMYIRTLKTIFFMSYRAGSVVVWIIAVIVVAVNIYFIISTVVGLFKSILVRNPQLHHIFSAQHTSLDV